MSNTLVKKAAQQAYDAHYGPLFDCLNRLAYHFRQQEDSGMAEIVGKALEHAQEMAAWLGAIAMHD